MLFRQAPLARWIFVACTGLLLSSCTDRSTDEAVGAEGRACYPNNSCNTGLVCLSGLCVRPTDAALPDGSTPDGSGPTPDSVSVDQGGGGNFSFFVTSLEAMRKLSGSQDGFGGDLGGLAGADKICQTIAAGVGGGAKTWRAFLSVTKGPGGTAVNAIDRVGQGPWYDRNGRLVAQDLAGLREDRPQGDAQIINDLPDEYGRGLKQFGDNHEVLTGSTKTGQLEGNDKLYTCNDWTSAVGPGAWKVSAGVSWPRTGKLSESWINARRVPGCAPGVNLGGGDLGTLCVGCKGGYGAIYCFALTP